MNVQPYLFFEGRCDEAIEFYTKAVGARTTVHTRYKDAPGTTAPGMGDKVLHACLRVGDSSILVSDGKCQTKAAFEGFGLSITVKDAAQAERIFAGLSDGGQVCTPMTKTFFSERFGMVTDRFGVLWMVYVE